MRRKKSNTVHLDTLMYLLCHGSYGLPNGKRYLIVRNKTVTWEDYLTLEEYANKEFEEDSRRFTGFQVYGKSICEYYRLRYEYQYPRITYKLFKRARNRCLIEQTGNGVWSISERGLMSLAPPWDRHWGYKYGWQRIDYPSKYRRQCIRLEQRRESDEAWQRKYDEQREREANPPPPRILAHQTPRTSYGKVRRELTAEEMITEQLEE